MVCSCHPISRSLSVRSFAHLDSNGAKSGSFARTKSPVSAVAFNVKLAEMYAPANGHSYTGCLKETRSNIVLAPELRNSVVYLISPLSPISVNFIFSVMNTHTHFSNYRNFFLWIRFVQYLSIKY